MQVLQVMKYKSKQHLYNYCNKEDTSCLRHARTKGEQQTKEDHIALRCNRNILNEQIKIKENQQYGPRESVK